MKADRTSEPTGKAGRQLTIAVTGMNATDNPGPGVPVIRALRDAAPDCRIIGLAYDTLDPGCYMPGIADAVYLMPYPSHGADVLLRRLLEIHARTPLDVVMPTLDAELSAYLKIADRLADHGIGTILPTAEGLKLRSKAELHDLYDNVGVRAPRGRTITDPALIGKLEQDLDYPLMVKGQFYEAAIAYTAADVHVHFERLRARWGLPIIIQEFVPGDEYDVTVLGDGDGGLIGHVAMRKMQLTDKGKAWGGVTVIDAALEAFIADTMAKLKWRGPAELEIMKSRETGEFYIIEINPRFPAWVYLTAGAGRNLPWAAVQLALGEAVAPMPPAPPGVMFLRHSFDQVVTLDDYMALTTAGSLHREAGLQSRDTAPNDAQENTPNRNADTREIWS